MTSKVQICNQALGMLSQKPITNLSDNTLQAETCNTYYQQVVDALLSSGDWNSATCQALLAAEATTPIWEYTYQYPLPSGLDPAYPFCLRVLKVNGDDEENDGWERRGNKILTDFAPPLKITYLGRVNETLFTPGLIDSIAAEMALRMAAKFTESGAKVQQAQSLGALMKADARRVDAKESKDSIIEASRWLNSRY